MPVINVKKLRDDQQDIAVFLGKQHDWIPNTHATLAHSSAALTAYHKAEESLQKGVLDARLRESIALAVAGANKSPYCVAMHAFMARQMGLSDEETALNLESISMDRKTGAVLNFVRLLVRDGGCVAPNEVEFLRNIGCSEEEVVEVVVNVGHNISANYLNLVAQPEIDLPESTV